MPFKQAIKFPFYISRRVWLKKMKGQVKIDFPVSSGMIEIGGGDVGVFDKKRNRSILEIQGIIIFKGNANIGHGSKISVQSNAVLVFGKNFRITAESTIICGKSITFGDDNLISWDNLFLDTDFHSIYTFEGKLLNEPKAILIGNNVWIGCRCIILKGCNLPKGSVIAANSIVANSFIQENTILGGNPLRILKSDISWTA